MLPFLFFGCTTAVLNPNPLGEGCLHMQYSALNDPNKVAIPFDVSNPSVSNGLDINNPPSLLSLARAAVGASFRTFVAPASRCRAEPWGDGAGWAGECRRDVSEIRDALSVFGNIYPFEGGIYTKGDPWRLLQENITHEGYHLTGDFLDLFSVVYRNATTGQFINQAHRDETYEELKQWQRFYKDTLGDGSKQVIVGGAGPTWMAFASLEGAINPDGSVISETNMVYTQRDMTRQFWGIGPSAKAEYGAYENLGVLMRTQFETAMDGLCGTPNCQYDRVMTFTDICVESPGYFQGEYVLYGVHEEFHDLRKQLRSMWKTLADYPPILPVAWFPYSIPNTNFLLFDIAATTYAQVVVPGKGTFPLLPMLFRNDPTTRTDLQAAGWPDGLIDLAIAMALGGYYKQEAGTSDAVIGTQSQWDFIQRFGWINNLFMEWKYATEAQIPKVELDAKRDRINRLWVDLKGWLERNKLRELLRVAVDYLPWPTCDGPPGQNRTDAPTMSAAPTSVDETLAPSPAPTSRPTVPPTVAIQPAFDTNLALILIDTSSARLKNETVKARMLLYTNLDGSLNSMRTSKPLDTGLLISIKIEEDQSRQLTNKRTFDMTIQDRDDSTQEKDFVLFPDWASEHDYTLEGPFHDSSLMRTALAYNLSRAIGMWAPRTAFAELYIQELGERYLDFEKNYQGVYLLRETVKRDKYRLDINRVDTVDPAKSGYLLELKHYNVDDSYWRLEYGGSVDTEYPPASQKTPELKTFIRTFLASFEEVLYGPDWVANYQTLLSPNSFVNYFLLSELLCSADAYLYNAYFYYDVAANGTGRLHAGPIFSFEYSLGNVERYVDGPPSWDGGSNDPAGWRYESRIRNRQSSDMSQWFGRLLGDPAFKNELVQTWSTHRAGHFSDSSIMAQIDLYTAELTRANSSARNDHMKPSATTFEVGVANLKTWVKARTQWMDENIAKPMFHTGAAMNSLCNEEPESNARRLQEIPSQAVVVSAPVFPARRLLGSNCPLECWGPFNDYPECQSKMEWMAANWHTDPKFAEGGVDGSTCSFQKFLYNENTAYCPDPCFEDPVRDVNGCETQCTGPWLYYPKCEANVLWLLANWGTSPRYSAGGVDGTRCSCQRFIHNETGLCPAVCNPSCLTGDCSPPSDGSYPECSKKMQWVAAHWKEDSKFAAGGVDGTSCSIERYLNMENTSNCPRPCDVTTSAPTPGAPPTPEPPTEAAAPTPDTPQPTMEAPTTPAPSPAPTVASPTAPVVMISTCDGSCYGPYPGKPFCKDNIDLMRANYNPVAYPTVNNNSICSFQNYLAAMGICPPLLIGFTCKKGMCVGVPTPPTSRPPTYGTPTEQKILADTTPPSTDDGMTTFFLIFVPILCVAVGIFAFFQYRKRTVGKLKHSLLDDTEQEPVNLPYRMQK